MKRLLFVFSALSLSAILMASCRGSAIAAGSVSRLTVQISNSAMSGRTLVADWDATITSYKVALTSNDGYASQSQSVSSGKSAKFDSVAVGSWNVQVTALRGSSIVGVGGLEKQILAADSTLNLSVAVSGAQKGTGSFSLAFAFPSSAGVDYVSAQLYDAAGNAVGDATTPALSVSGANLTGTIARDSIASGYYRLQLSFRRGGAGGSPAGVYSEAVNVWDNASSDQWLDPSGKLNALRTFSASDFSSTNSALSNLVINGGGSNLSLDPGFSSGQTSYAAKSSSTAVTLAATQSIGGQGIGYQVGSTAGSWVALGSGLASASIGLDSGAVTTLYVKVTAGDGTTSAVYRVDISIPVTGVSLDQESLALVLGGAQATLVASVLPAEASERGLTWSSSDPGVASVTNAGVVTGLKVGSARITATSADGGYTGTCDVSVRRAVASLSLNVSSETVCVGGSAQLVATIAPSDATDQVVTWASTDPTIAKVSSSGLVSGVAVGTATITATTEDGQKAATCAITVSGDSGGIGVTVR